jgi:hypothetical protein
MNTNQADQSRKNEAAILRALASVGQCRIAESMGVSESLISRMKSSGDLGKTAAMLANLGLKVVPTTMVCFDPAYVEHLRALAKIGLNSPASEQVLEWEE